MLTRYRWFRVQLPAGVRDFGALVEKCPLLPASQFGFTRIAASFNGADYRFLWRTRIVVTKLEADGSPSYEQIDSVSFTDFAFVALGVHTFLRVENPGRNIRDLLNALESIVGMGFTAKPITFDHIRPSAVFDAVDTSKLVGLKVVGAVVADDLVARMEFASKQGMKVEEMSVLNGLKYKVDLAVFELFLGGVRGQVAFAANGTVKVSGQLAPKLVSLIEQDLPTLI